jgi:TrpR-related protein YerC/YecD
MRIYKPFPHNRLVDNLLKAILLLRTKGESQKFLRDLLTEQEIFEFARRWEAAQLLNAGTSYLTIEKTTGLSSTTIARISKWLNNGSGGYQLMLKKIHSQPRRLFKKKVR